MNKVILIGNVGTDPNVRYLDSGVCVAQIRLATTERGYTLQNGTQVPERTEWHNVIFWRKLAEIVETHVHKGDKIFVDGKIQSRNYTDQQGLTRHVTEIMADNMEILVRKSDSVKRQEATQEEVAATQDTIKEINSLQEEEREEDELVF